MWEKTEIQMVILIFHLANWSPHLLSGALCSLAPQSFALKLAGSIVREERLIQAAAQQNLQENKPRMEPAARGAAASLRAILPADGEQEPGSGYYWATNLVPAWGAGDIAVYPDGDPGNVSSGIS